MPPKISMIGRKFNQLTVLALADTHPIVAGTNGKLNPRYQWSCLCNCGNEIVADGSNLRSGNTQSCGCRQKEMMQNRDTTVQALKACKSDSAFHRIIYGYRANAKKRHLAWNLTDDQVKALFQKLCAYCDEPPTNHYKTHYDRLPNTEYVYNGIDRIDNDKGYTPDNVCSCCGTCNRIKADMGVVEFLAWVERVYDHCIKPRLLQAA